MLIAKFEAESLLQFTLYLIFSSHHSIFILNFQFHILECFSAIVKLNRCARIKVCAKEKIM